MAEESRVPGVGGGDRPVCVRLSDVTKSFAGTVVVRGVDLDFRTGEIHGLVGQNGAGKSTVGKIVGGYYERSGGEIEVFGRRVSGWDSASALRSGVAMMHQELHLVPELTVAQNVFLGIEHNRAGFLRHDESARLASISEMCGFDLPADAKAGSLGIADQQKIEIMRAIAREAKVIVMDEPTSSLTVDEVERLHQTMRRLRQMGRTIIYVSHFLEHILEICDRVTVMRDGRVIRTADTADETKGTLVSAMIGKDETEVSFPPKPAVDRSARPVLSVSGMSAANGIRDVSLEIRPGEIVGLIGLVGSGRTEIARAIFGADPVSAGAVSLNGKAYQNRSPQESILRGLSMVPEDRRAQGLVMTQPVRPNMTLTSLGQFSKHGFIRKSKEIEAVLGFIRRLGIHPGEVDGQVVSYSGGNQQKVLLAKWIMPNPSVVILDEPSRGVDIGARHSIHAFVCELAAKGAGVLVISSEIEEVHGLCHRAYLVRRGSTVDVIEPGQRSTDEILHVLFENQTNEAVS